MEASNNNMAPSPTLCAEGCGFFGNSQMAGMCSKCYKDKVGKDKSAPPAQASMPAMMEAPQPISVCPAPREAPQAFAAAASFAPPRAPDAAALSGSAGLQTPPAAAASASASAAACGSADGGDPGKLVQTNTSRCWCCNKKIGLLGFQCKCEYFYCAGHRASDKHECAFDFKAMGKEQLTQANPTITPEKLQGF